MGGWRNGMTRRQFMGTVGAAGAATLLGGCATGPRAMAGKGKLPNIVFILADDLGYGDVGCMNSESKIATPNIDGIGHNGVIFTDAHSGSAVCSPTRYGIMTGRYSWRTRLKKGVLFGYSPPLIDSRRMTVASLLKSQGYRTACVGKWHLGLEWARTDDNVPGPHNVDFAKPIGRGPTTLGFDYFFGISGSLDMDPFVYIENDKVVELPTENTEGRKGMEYYRPGPISPHFKHEEVLPTLTQKAVAWIDRNAAAKTKEPLFLYLPLSAPHKPIVPTKDFAGKSVVGPYGDFVAETDWAVGEVVAALKRNGLLEDTLLICTSDNGFAPNETREKMLNMGHNPCWKLRGTKADAFEGGHRIPFVAQWPEHIQPTTSTAETVWLGDLLATVADVTGAQLPDNAGEDSVSMVPAMLGKKTASLREAVVHHSSEGAFAVRQGSWKLILYGGSGGWSYPKPADIAKDHLPSVQLYNLADDLGEKNNLWQERPEIVDRLTGIMEKIVTDGRSTPGAQQRNDEPVDIWKK